MYILCFCNETPQAFIQSNAPTLYCTDSIRLWDIEKAAAVSAIKGKHGSIIQDLKWNYDGSLVFTSCKDKFCR